MKKIFFSAFLISLTFISLAQDYLDLVKFTHTHIPSVKLKDYNSSSPNTSVTQTKISTSLPVKLNESSVFLTGIDYELHRVQLLFKPSFYGFNSVSVLSEDSTQETWVGAEDYQQRGDPSSPSDLHMTTLKLGFNKKHNNKLSGTYLALPKIASPFVYLKNSFQIGAIALWKYKFNDQTKLIFGNYINKEFFGILNVPILGVYHKSKNEKAEVDIKFPITGFGDYKIHKNIRIGADFLLIVRTFNLVSFEVSSLAGSSLFVDEDYDYEGEAYVHTSSNEIAAYFQLDLFKESLIIKLKGVYSMYDYSVFADHDKTPFGMLGWYPGDQRTPLNYSMSNALGFKISALYRFHL
ncbi:MAG: hypothetical protein CMP61_03890 [Flavobacteriales bacterium]|nr:hypothetical protein [Flavobacteriales bacterium]|tara:strand:+ start:2084 stop:3136 length:1053 start_codon:yes stop_codon:yes gene_type:complete